MMTEMTKSELTTLLLKRLRQRICATEGMALTHEVWNVAHEYEAYARQLRWRQHSGIVVGLEVVASSPEDSRICVKPGAAIAPNGQLIVVTEDQSFDLDNWLQRPGCWRVSVVFNEAQPVDSTDERFAKLNVKQSEQGYVVRIDENLPHGAVELARINIDAVTVGTKLLIQTEHIDQRFRPYADEAGIPILSVAVTTLGGSNNNALDYLEGVRALARAANYAGRLNVVADRVIAFASDWRNYDLIVIAMAADGELSDAQAQQLNKYLSQGGTVWAESISPSANVKQISETWCKQLGFKKPLDEINHPDSHPVLRVPHVFGCLPDGLTKQHPRVMGDTQPPLKGEVSAAKGLLISDAGYVLLWQGGHTTGGECATRTTIRAAHELGENLLVLAEQRRNEPSERIGGQRRGL